MPGEQVKFTKKAIKDLSLIWNYTCDIWSEKQADKYYKSIIQDCKRIAEILKVGRQYPKVIKSLRSSRINKHIIFYRILNEREIEIERILHERMDLKERLNE